MTVRAATVSSSTSAGAGAGMETGIASLRFDADVGRCLSGSSGDNAGALPLMNAESAHSFASRSTASFRIRNCLSSSSPIAESICACNRSKITPRSPKTCAPKELNRCLTLLTVNNTKNAILCQRKRRPAAALKFSQDGCSFLKPIFQLLLEHQFLAS